MSYEIRIIKADDPYEEPIAPLDVKTLIRAVNSFPPFVKEKITWNNQRWSEHAIWKGLVINLEEYEVAGTAAGAKHPETGTADACTLYVSLADEVAMDSCCALALHIAQATGATAWDLQTDQPIE